jgi:glycosyltransferase involved in cell wall biosynthesis
MVERLTTLGAEVVQFPIIAIGSGATRRFEREFERVFTANDVIYIAKGWYTLAPLAKSLGKPVVAHSHDYELFCPRGDLMFQGSSTPPDRIPCSPTQLLRCNIGYSRKFALEGLLSPQRAVVSTLLSLLKTIRDFRPWRDLYESMSYIDHLILVSEHARRMITSHIPSLRGRCSVIYNPAIDLGYITPGDSPTLRLGYFGGASYIKGYRLLLRSLKSLKDTLPQASIELVATRTKGTAFSKLVKSLRLGAIVQELPQLSRDELAALYERIDAVVVPSLWPEPFPYVALEAQLFGRPVIASNAGGLPEIVEHEKTGWLFRPAEQKALTALLEQLLLIPKAELRNIGLRARIHSSRFVQADPIRELVSILEKCGHV